jgi:hypothetical protein
MKTKNIIIASACKQEAITNCVINNAERFEKNVSVVLLSDILLNYDIFDELNDSKNIINWYENNELIISSKTHLLLNRVLYFNNELFVKFQDEDKNYARREFEAYIGFSFNSFLGVSNKNPIGLCEKPLALPCQWRMIKDNLHLKTPTYYWGLQKLNPLKNNRIVQSDIYDFLNWRISKEEPEEKHIFCFEKPKGDPIFALVVGSKIMLTSNSLLSNIFENELMIICEQISSATHHFIYEVLFFYDGVNLTFGCINPDIIHSVKNNKFDDFIINNLISEFMSCLN